MGFKASLAGFRDAEDMVLQMMRSENEQIVVQRLLVIRGFNPGDIDGFVGPRTRAAITAFVQAQGASPTDAVDAGLLNALLVPYDNGAEAGARA